MMSKEELLQLFKFYRGEEESPYTDEMADRWWYGESLFYKQLANDDQIWETFASWLKEGIEKGHVSGFYLDENIPFEKRVITFYLDLWHGKWFPYDDWGAIDDYIKA